jgi:hypothetical protein
MNTTATVGLTPASVWRATTGGDNNDQPARRRQGTCATAANQETTAGDDLIAYRCFTNVPIGLRVAGHRSRPGRSREEETNV